MHMKFSHTQILNDGLKPKKEASKDHFSKRSKHYLTFIKIFNCIVFLGKRKEPMDVVLWD